MILEFKNVMKKGILDETNLKLEEGKSLLILSNDKSRSSSIMKMIVGLQKPNKGKIFLFDHNSDKALTKAKAFIGYTNGLKIKGNLTVYGYLAHTESFYKASYKEEINKYLSLFKLDPDKKVYDLNEFEKINLSIVNILFFNPSMIILDNIIDYMDNNSLIILDNILHQKALEGVSILVSSRTARLKGFNEYYYLKDNILIKGDDLNNYYKVSLITNDNIDIDGIKTINGDNRIKSFIYKGDIGVLIKRMHQLDVSYISISSPSYEDLYE